MDLAQLSPEALNDVSPKGRLSDSGGLSQLLSALQQSVEDSVRELRTTPAHRSESLDRIQEAIQLLRGV